MTGEAGWKGYLGRKDARTRPEVTPCRRSGAQQPTRAVRTESITNPPRDMEFFEFVFLFSVAFVLPLTILKMALDYKKAKVRTRTGEGKGSGVTAGELRRLLREAVEEANAPLLARIDELETIMLPTARVEENDDRGEENDHTAEPQERTLGRRVNG